MASQRPTRRDARWLIWAVAIHLVISLVHGFAHGGGHVSLSPAQSFFVFGVILIGPVAGLGVSVFRPRAGGLIVAATMAASLVFGLVNHFIIVSPDHVSQVAAEWRSIFATTATLLVAAEAAGTVAGLRYGLGPQEVRS